MQPENTLIGGRYRLGKKIGQGGFAQVFLAVDTVLERPVAIKILNSDMTEEKDFLERFGKEARAIATLEHPNILGIYDYGQLADSAFIVMPYVEGGSLHDKLRREGRFSLPQAGYYLSQAAAALDYAHRRNLVHRDVKPQNMLLRTEDDRLLLTDFGISKILSSASAQSRTGIMGTLSYMSPEQLGGNVGRGTDIYALGCVLFQLLTGQLPYPGPTEQVIMGHMMSPIPSIVERSQGQLPPAIQVIIEKALAKKIEDRYQSAGEMAQAFQAVLSGTPYPVSSQPQSLANWNTNNPAQPLTQPYNPPPSSSQPGPSFPLSPAPNLQPPANLTPANASQSDPTQLAGQPAPGNYDRTQIASQTNPGNSDKNQLPNQPNAGSYDLTQIPGQSGKGSGYDQTQIPGQPAYDKTQAIFQPSAPAYQPVSAKAQVAASAPGQAPSLKNPVHSLGGLPWWLWWTLGTFLALPVSWSMWFLFYDVVFERIIFTRWVDSPNAALPFRYLTCIIIGGLVGGAVIGTGQWLGLRSILPVKKLWILVSALGWATAFTISLYKISFDRSDSQVDDLLIFAGAGLILGLIQWSILRRVMTQAIWWMPVNLVALLVGFYLANPRRSLGIDFFGAKIYDAFGFHSSRRYSLISGNVIIFLLIGSAVFAIVTAVALWFLFRKKQVK